MLRIIFPNRIDADEGTLTSITATSEDSGLPVTHLQEQPRSRIWSTAPGVTAASIKGDWSGITRVGAMAFVRHNLTPNATTRFRLFAGPGQTGTVLYDSGTVSRGTDLGWGNFQWGYQAWGGSSIFASWAYQFDVIWLPAVVTTAFSFQYDISDPASPDNHLEGSRLFIGDYIELSEGASRGSGWYWDEATQQKRSAGGSLRSEDNFVPFRIWEIKLDYLDEDDRALLMELTRAAGKRRDMFISLHPGEGALGAPEKERDGAGIVKITDLPKIASLQQGWEQHQASIVFQES